MKKTLVALASLAAVASASAEVTLYGILDMGYTSVSNSPNADLSNVAILPVQPTNSKAASAGRVSGLYGSNTAASRWGLRGSEDMGGGLHATFNLESALNVAGGSIPNSKVNDSIPGVGSTSLFAAEGSNTALFSRNANVGLNSKDYGALTLGRQTTVMADQIGAYDPMRAGAAVSPIGYYGGFSGAGFTSEARWDASAKYTKSFGNTTLSLGYKTGLTNGGEQQGRGLGLGLEQNMGDFSVAASMLQINDAMANSNGSATCTASAATQTTCNSAISSGVPALKATFADTSAWQVVGRYTMGNLTAKGGVQSIRVKNPKHASYDTSSNYISAFGLPISTVSAGSYDTPQDTRLSWIGANYQLTPKWELSAAYYYRTDSAYGTTGAATLAGNSTAKFTSMMAQYGFSKRTSGYVTFNTVSTTGPAYNVSGYGDYPTLTVYSMGVRHSF